MDFLNFSNDSPLVISPVWIDSIVFIIFTFCLMFKSLQIVSNSKADIKTRCLPVKLLKKELIPFSPRQTCSGQNLIQNDEGILISLENSLWNAKSLSETWHVRTSAKALKEAIKFLNRRDLEVEFAAIMARAERKIAKSNPPIPPKSRGRGKKKPVARTV